MDKKVLEIYEQELENAPMAHDELRAAYAAIHDALEDYVIEIQKASFCFGFETGRKYSERKGEEI